MKIKGRIISKGKTKAKVLISKNPISFLGDIDPKTGIVVDKKSDIFNKCIKDKILVFPMGKGSTVGSYVMLSLKKNKVAPKGIINIETETIILVGAIISKIPLIDNLEKNPYDFLKNDMKITLDCINGFIEI